jgi:hypothetical protein
MIHVSLMDMLLEGQVCERRRGTITEGKGCVEGSECRMWKLEGRVQVKSHRGKDESEDGR